MSKFDHETLERITDVILGDQPWAPKTRGSYHLSSFFRDCGFADFEHDGSARRPWTLAKLEGASDSQLQTVVLRLGSPKEYGGDQQQHSKALASINRILAIEGLEVTLDSDLQPRFEKVSPRFSTPLEGSEAPHVDLERPELSIISDSKLGPLLGARWREADLCFQIGAYLSCLIMLGSILETLLLVALRRNSKLLTDSGIIVKDDQGRPKQLSSWGLSDMIEVAHKLGWTKDLTRQFGHAVREYRNLVHPEVQARRGLVPGSEECRITAIVIASVVRDVAPHISVGTDNKTLPSEAQ
jgi:hypothetical protein